MICRPGTALCCLVLFVVLGRQSQVSCYDGTNEERCVAGALVEAWLSPCPPNAAASVGLGFARNDVGNNQSNHQGSLGCWVQCTLIQLGRVSASEVPVVDHAVAALRIRQTLGPGVALIALRGKGVTDGVVLHKVIIPLEHVRNTSTSLPCARSATGSGGEAAEGLRPVPRVIHQTAPRDRSRWHAWWPRLHAGWRRICPPEQGYIHMFWDDNDLRELVVRVAPQFLDIYDNYSLQIHRIDFARSLVLLTHGGLYADMDVEALSCPFCELPAGRVSVVAGPEVPWEEAKHLNSLMASPAGEHFWRLYLDEAAQRALDERASSASVYHLTGPGLLDHVIGQFKEKYAGEVNVLPAKRYNPQVGFAGFDASDVVTRHHVTNTWIHDEASALGVLGADNTLLHNVVALGHVSMLDHVLRDATKKSDPSIYFSLLHVASFGGHAEIVQHLVSLRAEIERREGDTAELHDGKTPLHLSAQRGHLNVMKLLISLRALINAVDNKGSHSLHVAASNGDAEVVNYLLGAQADVHQANGFGQSALHLAAQIGHAQVVATLVTSRAEVHTAATDSNWETPLHAASRNGHLSVLSELRSMRASVDSLDRGGNQPLHYAARVGALEVAQRLLADGASASVANRETGATAMQLAVAHGHLEFTEYLVAQVGIDPGLPLSTGIDAGSCAIHAAAFNGHGVLIDLLVERRADIDAIDGRGWLPIDWAALGGHTATVQLLDRKFTESRSS